MTTEPPASLRFVPSAVEGLPEVKGIVIFSDRLEVISEGSCQTVRFRDVARWFGRGRLLFRLLARLGGKIRGWPAVADRDWFHPPSGRFFRFYTTPPLTVFLPDEPLETPYTQTLFRRIQDVLAAGGFSTMDLG